MADDNEPKPIVLKAGEVVVDQTTLQKIQDQMTKLEQEVADAQAKAVGIEDILAQQGAVDAPDGEKKLRERKNFEPAFRTVRLRKYPMAGDIENPGWVVGWTNRGAYQKVDKTGVAPVLVDYIDIIFLGHEKNAEGKLQAESVPLLDLLNKGDQVYCKIVEVKKTPHKDPTNEEINVTIWDPAHGLVATGDIIDGYVAYTDIEYTVVVPGVKDPVKVDGKYVN